MTSARHLQVVTKDGEEQARAIHPSVLRRTAPTPDGGAVISREDYLIVLGAISDATALHGTRIGRCKQCGPGQTCDQHQGDSALVSAYQSLMATLRGDR